MLIPCIILVLAAAASVWAKKLTPLAAFTGFVIGLAVFAGGGYNALVLLALFFVLGTAATAWKKTDKLSIKGSAAHQSTRNTGQVLANGGVAALLGAFAFFFPDHRELFLPGLAAALSSATADTLSSELGIIYGRRSFDILSLKRMERGPDGVISIEGLLFGLAGSAIIAAVYGRHFVLIIAAGLIGNLADSLLGATLERRGMLSNDTVNFLNTAIAAFFAMIITGFHG